MGHQQDLFRSRGQQAVGDDPPVPRVQQAGGLIGDDQARLGDHDRAHGQPLQLTRGEGLAGLVGQLQEVMFGQRFLDHLPQPLPAELPPAQAQRHVLPDGGHDGLRGGVGEEESDPLAQGRIELSAESPSGAHTFQDVHTGEYDIYYHCRTSRGDGVEWTNLVLHGVLPSEPPIQASVGTIVPQSVTGSAGLLGGFGMSIQLPPLG